MSGGNVSPDFPARTPVPLVTSRPFNVKLIVDRSSIGAFAQNGTIAMTNLIFPPSQSSKVVLFPATGKAGSVTGKIWRLRSIWE
jgi:fructan beta-fructosidase